MHISIICSVDSFVATAMMAFAGCPEVYQRRTIFAFTACDMIASLAGAMQGIAVPTEAVPAALAVGILALTSAWRWPALYVFVPLMLSVDNLALGAADPPIPLGSAALDGLWSGGLAWLGFTLVGSLQGSWPRRRSGERTG